MAMFLNGRKSINLVLEGGGTKGVAYAGCLRSIEKRCRLNRVMGTSAGAITAGLVYLGYSSEEILTAMTEKVDNKPLFESFLDVPNKFSFTEMENSVTFALFDQVSIPFISFEFERKIDWWIFRGFMRSKWFRKMFSLVEKGGLYEGRVFTIWLQGKVDAKLPGMGRSSFKEIKSFLQRTGRQKIKDLTVIAADITNQRILELNAENSPDLPIVEAIRMSMSIPGVWQEKRWLSEWGKYKSEDVTGIEVVDGGLLSNFPIELMNSKTDPKKEFLLGILLDESRKAPSIYEYGEPKKITLQDSKLFSRFYKIVEAMRTARDNEGISKHQTNICFVPVKGYRTLEMNMTEEQITDLVTIGEEAMTEFLRRRDGSFLIF